MCDVVEKYFPKQPPFNGKPRDAQGDVIERMYQAVVGGKRFLVIAAPTGAGKSAILYTLANAICDLNGVDHRLDGSGAIFTTSQKVLQDQYEEDFQDMFVMKGRGNYPCKQPVESEESNNCDAGICLFRETKPDCDTSCPYKQAKIQAQLNKLIVTNFAYFIGESNNVNAFGKRRVLMIDEAHNIESALMSYVECGISEAGLKFCGLERIVPIFDRFGQYEDFLVQLSKDAKERAIDLKGEMEQNPSTVFTDKAKQYDRAMKLFQKTSFIRFHAETCKWIPDADADKRKVVFKPINVSPFARNLVFAFGDINILSSATISKSYVKNCLGIPDSDFEYFEVPSTFPVENRPIYAMNAGKMGYRYLEKSLPNIVRKIDAIIDQFPDSKGIIHATSYKIAKYVSLHSRHAERFISHNSVDRIERLRDHMKSPEPTILLSPSMTEGVDLKGDLSRFQIIVKIPYASLGDKQIKARMEEDKIWYANLAAVTLMQAYGRSIRSKSDTAITFVLDSAFKYFVKSNDHLFCNWFKEAIR